MGLRVQVDKQDKVPQLGQTGSQRQAGGGLRHASFLVTDDNGLCHSWYLLFCLWLTVFGHLSRGRLLVERPPTAQRRVTFPIR